MKLLGHAWVAVNSIKKGNRRQVIIGSILPEIMYYTKSNPFIKSEIHEGGDVFYQFLKTNHPEFKNLGLGMITHSVKYGADRFNFDDRLAILEYSDEKVLDLRKKLVEILHVDFETSKTRAHNILELGIEVGIIRDHPEFTTEFCDAIADTKLKNQTVKFLSECFKKDKEEVKKAVNELFDKAKPEYFENAKGLAALWLELSKNFDPKPDIVALSVLLTNISNGFDGRDKLFLAECIMWTAGNIK